ncbi:translation elongation factor Ts [Blattabacterium sp. (Blaberus giganteus)]|uniref:translation elongation factor Ts n=1 Tax=Blattabacterium sp. (Blaberus giganteus) TaxID=1186051 RepID=UPI00025F6F93|nr:translation elongation factor Ts [Blattabacterium sp. (Blaberus giganteus)]AFJ90835.1 translation elongation factor EF-Ts [Blattabacterium sp. (Blaberus giganteus)]
MKVSLEKINKLRKLTGIGIMDCKKALIHSNGNIDDAIRILRKKGEKIAINRSSYHMKDGALISSVNSNYSCGTIIGISCETDFLSKSYEFLDFLSILSKQSLLFNNKVDFLYSPYNEYKSIQEMIETQMGVVGEKLELKIFEKIDSPFVMNYTHYTKKIAVLVSFSYKINESIAKNIAMHIAAMNPVAINEKEIPVSLMNEEIEMIQDQIDKNNKFDSIKKKMIQGKIKKFVLENTLLNQKFIKNTKITVQKYLDKYDKNLKINLFKRVRI